MIMKAKKLIEYLTKEKNIIVFSVRTNKRSF